MKGKTESPRSLDFDEKAEPSKLTVALGIRAPAGSSILTETLALEKRPNPIKPQKPRTLLH